MKHIDNIDSLFRIPNDYKITSIPIPFRGCLIASWGVLAVSCLFTEYALRSVFDYK